MAYTILYPTFLGKQIMKIAVIGAGFCGLAACYYLADIASVVLYDKQGIGAGASGITAGLIHPYVGPRAQVSWMAHEALAETTQLLKAASKAISSTVYDNRGILRPETASMDFSKSKNFPDVTWWDAKTCQEHIPELLPLPGLFIKSGLTVNCPRYIQGMWLACQQKQVTFQQAHIVHPSELSGFDFIVFTVGAGQNELKDVLHPPVTLIKGQTLQLEWKNPSPLPFAINAGVQLAQIEPSSVWAGATYERKWTTHEPDPKAEEEIRKKVALFSPVFSQLALKSIWTSFRAATGDKKPFIIHTAPNVYCLGGMGSKGLLYHAWMAKRLLSCVQERVSLPPC